MQNNLIEMFISTAHSLKFSALRLVARSGGGGELILEASRWHFARNAHKLCRLDYYFCRVHLENRINSFSIMFSMSQKLETESVSPSMSLKMGYDCSED